MEECFKCDLQAVCLYGVIEVQHYSQRNNAFTQHIRKVSSIEQVSEHKPLKIIIKKLKTAACIEENLKDKR